MAVEYRKISSEGVTVTAIATQETDEGKWRFQLTNITKDGATRPDRPSHLEESYDTAEQALNAAEQTALALFK